MELAINDTTTAQAARMYVAEGWKVVLLHRPVRGEAGTVVCSCGVDPAEEPDHKVGKHPIGTIHPHGSRDAIGDPEALEAALAELDARGITPNLAVILPPGVACIDLDPPRGERTRHGGEVLGEFAAAHPDPGWSRLFAAPSEDTGSTGVHLLVEDLGLSQRIGALEGVDYLRSGAMLTVAPSLHVSGRTNQWVRPPSLEGPFPAVPAPLANFLAPLGGYAELPPGAQGVSMHFDLPAAARALGGRWPRRAAAWAAGGVERATEQLTAACAAGPGRRNNELFRQAAAVSQLGALGLVTGDAERAKLGRIAEAAGMASDEVTATLRSAQSRAADSVRETKKGFLADIVAACEAAGIEIPVVMGTTIHAATAGITPERYERAVGRLTDEVAAQLGAEPTLADVRRHVAAAVAAAMDGQHRELAQGICEFAAGRHRSPLGAEPSHFVALDVAQRLATTLAPPSGASGVTPSAPDAPAPPHPAPTVALDGPGVAEMVTALGRAAATMSPCWEERHDAAEAIVAALDEVAPQVTEALLAATDVPEHIDAELVLIDAIARVGGVPASPERAERAAKATADPAAAADMVGAALDAVGISVPVTLPAHPPQGRLHGTPMVLWPTPAEAIRVTDPADTGPSDLAAEARTAPTLARFGTPEERERALGVLGATWRHYAPGIAAKLHITPAEARDAGLSMWAEAVATWHPYAGKSAGSWAYQATSRDLSRLHRPPHAIDRTARSLDAALGRSDGDDEDPTTLAERLADATAVDPAAAVVRTEPRGPVPIDVEWLAEALTPRAAEALGRRIGCFGYEAGPDEVQAAEMGIDVGEYRRECALALKRAGDRYADMVAAEMALGAGAAETVATSSELLGADPVTVARHLATTAMRTAPGAEILGPEIDAAGGLDTWITRTARAAEEILSGETLASPEAPAVSTAHRRLR